jgi:hypothetical protein
VLDKKSWNSRAEMREHLWILDEYYRDQKRWEPYYWPKYGEWSSEISPHYFIAVRHELVAVTAGTIGNGWPKAQEIITKLVGA